MLRAYQLSSAPRSHDSWTLKDRADNTDSTLRARTVSTHILGLGIVLVGVVFLAVGLIMGLEFPKYVYEKNKEAQCVLHTDHENYRSWQSGIQWKRKVKIYYWILNNKHGFLYRQQRPVFVQKGPYVFIETEEKSDVRFAVSEVSFRKRIRYSFDKTATEAECKSCGEYDSLTILNRWYLQRVHEKGGEIQMAWELIPTYMTLTLTVQGLAVHDGTSLHFQQNVSILGNFHKDSVIRSWPLSEISFGTWLSNKGATFSTVIQAHTNDSQLTTSETRAIYSVFTNTTLLYGSIYSQDITIQNSENNLHIECGEWASVMCSHKHSPQKLQADVLKCGVVYLLYKCHEHNYDSSEVSRQLHSVFCLSDNVCLNFTAMHDDVAFGFRKMLSLFLVHLTDKVFTNVLPSDFYDLVIFQNQSDLALGFEFESNDVVSSFFAKGLLYQDRHSTGDSVWTLYTCLKDRDTSNNMKVKEYQGHRTVPKGMLKNEAWAVSLTSYTDLTRPCSHLQPCVDCDPLGPGVSVFVEDLVRPVHFIHRGRTSNHSVDVDEYVMANNTFTNSTSNILTTSGVQDVSDVTGFMAWMGLPKADAAHGYSYMDIIVPSILQVEPVTGKVWHKRISLQFNVGVSQENGQSWNRSISGDYLELPLPVHWSERVMDISNDEVDEFEQLVIRLMRASCGGLIAFSIIAIIIVVVGIVICIYPFKPNRITPMSEDTHGTTAHSRHI